MKQLVILILLFICIAISAQNRYEEIIPYENIDGKIIIKAKLNGYDYKFLLDTRARTTILDDIETEVAAERKPAVVDFIRPDVDVLSACIIDKLCVGENIFIDKKPAFLIKDDYLKSIGVSGILSVDVFFGCVLTIDSRDKTITISIPYKPAYMPLKNKVETTDGNKFLVSIGGKPQEVTLDLTANFMLAQNVTGFKEIETLLGNKKEHIINTSHSGYKPVPVSVNSGVLPSMRFAETEINDITVVSSDIFKDGTILGAGILDYGIISLDYKGKRIFFQPYSGLKKTETLVQALHIEEIAVEGKPIHLDKPTFFNDIFDYRQQSEWKYAGKLPAIIDFWAEWCGPCKKLSPVYEELAKEYKDKVIFYKLNVDEEKEIARYFKASPLPLLLYIPIDGTPVRAAGFSSKEKIVELINQHLLK